MFTLEELMFIKCMYLLIYLQKIIPNIWESLKNHRVFKSFIINVMAQLVWVDLRKTLCVIDPPNS